MTFPGLVRANNLNDIVDQEKAWDNLGDGIATGDISIATPSLDLNFAANKSLVDDISGNNLITFSRASTGTFVGSNGLIQTAASGVPRFDHNPATGESLGLLVEEARTNLVTYSEQLNNAAWSSISTGTPVVTPNILAAPDGTITGDLVVGDNVNTWIANNCGAVSAGPYSFSVWLKSDIAQTANIFMSFGVTDTLTCSVTTSWQRFTLTATRAATAGLFAGINVGNAKNIYAWGFQLEAGSFPTSYIPTVASTVTRAADLASITGANFSSWWNAGASTYYASAFSRAVGRGNNAILGIADNASERNVQLWADVSTVQMNTRVNGTPYASIVFTTSLGVPIKAAGIVTAAQIALCVNGVLGTTSSPPRLASSAPTTMDIGRFLADSQYSLNGTIARLAYWPSPFNDKSLQYITQPSITAINLYAFTYAINGKDVLALNAVRNASTRNFIFIKGLLSAAQPRLTTAAASTSSALTLATNALPKLSPTSSGNYFFASGITLSGVITRINGTNALSIATSPFSGSTATAPLLFRELRPQANWRFTEPMPSGTIASPEFAIPFETNDFVLFMKAGPN